MDDFGIVQQEGRKENYRCEEVGKIVKKCNNESQCFDCALMQSQQEEYEAQAMEQYFKDQRYHEQIQNEEE